MFFIVSSVDASEKKTAWKAWIVKWDYNDAISTLISNISTLIVKDMDIKIRLVLYRRGWKALVRRRRRKVGRTETKTWVHFYFAKKKQTNKQMPSAFDSTIENSVLHFLCPLGCFVLLGPNWVVHKSLPASGWPPLGRPWPLEINGSNHRNPITISPNLTQPKSNLT